MIMNKIITPLYVKSRPIGKIHTCVTNILINVIHVSCQKIKCKNKHFIKYKYKRTMTSTTLMLFVNIIKTDKINSIRFVTCVYMIFFKFCLKKSNANEPKL